MVGLSLQEANFWHKYYARKGKRYKILKERGGRKDTYYLLPVGTRMKSSLEFLFKGKENESRRAD